MDTRITTTTDRTLVQGIDYSMVELSTWLHWASLRYWYAIGTGTVAYQDRERSGEYALFTRVMNGQPTDTDIVALQEWVDHMPSDAGEIAHRAWARK